MSLGLNTGADMNCTSETIRAIMKISVLKSLVVANMSGQAEQFEKFAEECMSDYDLDGWTNDTWINPDDVSYFKK